MHRQASLVLVILGAAAAITALAAVLHHHNKTNKSVEAVSVNPTALYDAFTHYKHKHNLTWGKSEDDLRFNVFCDNFKIIAEHNAKPNATYKLGVTSLAHYTREEFAALKLGYRGQNKVISASKVHVKVDVPETVDWTTKNAVTDIKNQGQCGSCWSFSATGSLEGLNAIKNQKLVPLSEQELVDCSSSYGNMGCNGGLMDYAFQYVEANGIASEADYPYTAADGDCKTVKKAFKNTGHEDVAVDDDNALVAAVANQPVSVAIEADTSAFQLYTSGIITGDACGTALDHGVLAVGYGKDYIKVKNSWGASWGQAGYVLIGRADGAGICGINSKASYPTL